MRLPSPQQQNNRLRHIDNLSVALLRLFHLFTPCIFSILLMIALCGSAIGAEQAKQNYSIIPIAIIRLDDAGKQLRYPSNVFFDKTMNETYVLSSGRLIIYGPNNFPTISLGAGRGITSPQDIYVDAEGYLYICQAASLEKPPRITILNAAFFPFKEILLTDPEINGSFNPSRLAIGRDGTFYLSGNSQEVLVLDKNGAYLRKIEVFQNMSQETNSENNGTPGSPVTITGIATDIGGNILLLSEETSKIYVFNDKEEFLFSFGKKGGIAGKMSRPRAFALDETNNLIYVVDYMRHSILAYDYSGKYLFEFGGKGWGPGWFNFPTDLAITPQGHVIVADLFNNRVQILAVQYKKSRSAFTFKAGPVLPGEAENDFAALFSHLIQRLFPDGSALKSYKNAH